MVEHLRDGIWWIPKTAAAAFTWPSTFPIQMPKIVSERDNAEFLPAATS